MAGGDELARLARRLKEAGEGGLKRDLYKAIDGAVRPLAREIGNAEHLRPYLPNRYAGVLASDLAVTVSKLTGPNPGVRLIAKGRVKKRKVQQLDAGVLHHPVFGDRERWVLQLRGMRAGFFTDPTDSAAAQVRAGILAAMRETARKIEGK